MIKKEENETFLFFFRITDVLTINIEFYYEIITI